MKQGDVHDEKLEPKEALGFYLEAEKIEPENVQLLLSIARQYRHWAADAGTLAEKMKLSQTGKDYAKRAQALAPGDAETHLSVAISHAKMVPILDNKEKVEASREVRAAVDKSIELDPKKDLAWHVLGGWHQRLAELGTVKRALAKMLYGEMPPASNEEAVKCFEKAIELNPKRSIHHIELGRSYAQMGKSEEAKKCIEKGLEMPDSGKDDQEVKQRGRETLEGLK
jgi:tetratricopeptide (TPR) repeat protein